VSVHDLRVAAVLATLILFGVPSVLLGMVSPYAVRLKMRAVESAGRTAGSLYALSTVGSIAGTFLAGFVLISHFGNSAILFFLAALLAGASLAASMSASAVRVAVLILFAGSAAASDAFGAWLRGPSFLDVNTRYNRVWIYDAYDGSTGAPIKVMQINDEMSSRMLLRSDDLADDYTRYYRLAGHFKPDLRKALMIGGAAYSYPKDFLRHYPEGRIDVVEIDPGLTGLAREHFRMKDDPRLRIRHEDARTYLNRTTETYDAIFGDAFRSYSVPHQLTTLEVVRRMHDRLSDDGVVILNLISSIEGDKGRFLRAEAATFARVFPRVMLFPAAKPDDGSEVQNVILVALKSDKKPKFYSRDTELDGYLHHLWLKKIENDQPPLTDDFAPVERYMLPIMTSLRRDGANPVRELWENVGKRFRKEKN
jgi:spermidine synthase